MKRNSLMVLIIFLMAFAETLNARNSHPLIIAKFIPGSLNMDGKMSDPAWAQTTSYALELPLKIYSIQPESMQKTFGPVLSEKGSVKLLWSDKYLYVGGTFEDSDVVADGKTDQAMHCTTGDVIEIFLKPETDTYYWEIYGTPHNKKTCIFYPGRGRLSLPSNLENNYSDIIVKASVNGTLNNWRDRDTGWTVEVAIPIKKLTEFGAKFDNSTKWTILVARYNYSRYLTSKELSAFPLLSSANFHLYEGYASLNLKK